MDAGRKALAEQRVGTMTFKEELVRIRQASSSWAAIKRSTASRIDPNFPQRRVYLDAYEIDKYEVTNLHYLKYILATGKLPQLDWRYDGGISRSRWRTIRSCM